MLDLSLEDCLDDCRRIGFDGIEMGHKMPDEGGALRAKLAEYGLRFAAGWHSTNILVNPMETEITALQASIDFTKAAGGTTSMRANAQTRYTATTLSR